LLQQYTLALTPPCCTTQSHLDPIHISNLLQIKNTQKELIRLIFNNCTEVTGSFNSLHPSTYTTALRSTRPLTEMATRNILGDKVWLVGA
jgi:hypothetical protein